MNFRNLRTRVLYFFLRHQATKRAEHEPPADPDFHRHLKSLNFRSRSGPGRSRCTRTRSFYPLCIHMCMWNRTHGKSSSSAMVSVWPIVCRFASSPEKSRSDRNLLNRLKSEPFLLLRRVLPFLRPFSSSCSLLVPLLFNLLTPSSTALLFLQFFFCLSLSSYFTLSHWSTPLVS